MVWRGDIWRWGRWRSVREAYTSLIGLCRAGSERPGDGLGMGWG